MSENEKKDAEVVEKWIIEQKSGKGKDAPIAGRYTFPRKPKWEDLAKMSEAQKDGLMDWLSGTALPVLVRNKMQFGPCEIEDLMKVFEEYGTRKSPVEAITAKVERQALNKFIQQMKQNGLDEAMVISVASGTFPGCDVSFIKTVFNA